MWPLTWARSTGRALDSVQFQDIQDRCLKTSRTVLSMTETRPGVAACRKT